MNFLTLIVLTLNYFGVSTYQNHVVFDIYCYEDNSGLIASLNMEYVNGEYVIDEIVDVSTATHCTHINEDDLVTSIESFAWNMNMLYLDEFELAFQDGTRPQSFDWQYDEVVNALDTAATHKYTTFLPLVMK